MKAMILAAGLGTRLKPWTDHHPKALALVNRKSLLQRNIEYLQQYGIREVIVNVHHFAEQVEDAITSGKGWGSVVTLSDETDEVLETGGGLQKAKWYFDQGDFLVLNVDILTDLNLGEMISYHKRHQPLATLAVRNRITSRYFLFDENNSLCGWENVKTGEVKMARPSANHSRQAFSGIHIINPLLFQVMKRTGKFSMVDAYLDLAASHTIKAFDHSSSAFMDVGKPESVIKAEAIFQ